MLLLTVSLTVIAVNCVESAISNQFMASTAGKKATADKKSSAWRNIGDMA